MTQTQIPIARKGEILKAILTELKKAGGRERPKNLIAAAELTLNLTEYERAVLEKSGYVRWHTVVHFYSIDCVKAGYITKSTGYWTLTPKGEEALSLPAEKLIKSAVRKYREWRSSQPPPEGGAEGDAEDSDEDLLRQTAYDQAVEQASSEIEEHIRELGPYDFQKLVAELLRGMGYHVPFVAPPGPDGGIDIIAYKDPLGTTTPRIRVQVKHRVSNKVNVGEVRALEGVLRKEGDMGLIVSSGGFTPDAHREIQVSSKHIETMDLDRVITLWQQHYDAIREQGKTLLPLVKVHFLAPTEE